MNEPLDRDCRENFLEYIEGRQKWTDDRGPDPHRFGVALKVTMTIATLLLLLLTQIDPASVQLPEVVFLLVFVGPFLLLLTGFMLYLDAPRRRNAKRRLSYALSWTNSSGN
ncbi:MAG: hypothetical protein ACTSYL_10795 [Candidatus Thorarchaeota archaeon]